MVDHQIAHIYTKPGYEKAVRRVLEEVDGIDMVLDGEGKNSFQVNHPRSGDFIAVSSKNRWFSYYWWEDRSREPDFATHVDIHRKPGYDPLELFVDFETHKISQDTSLIKGSHGYPAMEKGDYVPFLISGKESIDLAIPEALCMTDIAGIIEKILVES
jgi:hypothetical protein